MASTTAPRRAVAGVGALVVVLFGVGTAAATVQPSWHEPDQQVVAGGAGEPAEAGASEETAVAEPDPATATAPAPAPAPDGPPIMSPAEVLAAFAQAASTTAAPPPTTAGAATATTRAAAPVRPPTTRAPSAPVLVDPPPPTRPLIEIDPTSGPSATFTVSGRGCLGAGAGVALTVESTQGRPMTGDGTSARPDGTWSLPISLALRGGGYIVRAKCLSGSMVLFDYEPGMFTVGPLQALPVVG